MNDSLWLAWSADPTALVGIPLAAILYARGLRSLERWRIHDKRRAASFYMGLIALFVALVSPLDALSDELFLAHMGQHMLLMFFAVPAIQIGAPVMPLMRGIPRPIRRRVAIPDIQVPARAQRAPQPLPPPHRVAALHRRHHRLALPRSPTRPR